MTRRRGLAAALALQVALLAWVSWPRLAPRLSGDEYRVLVRAVDPVDPFRGRYVDLDYRIATHPQEGDGRVWVPLERRSSGRYRLGEASARRPRGPVLRCDADGADVDCGIESFFAAEGRARRLDRALRDRGAIARLKVDDEGRAAIVGLDPR